jgi:hypothetical protein
MNLAPTEVVRSRMALGRGRNLKLKWTEGQYGLPGTALALWSLENSCNPMLAYSPEKLAELCEDGLVEIPQCCNPC